MNGKSVFIILTCLSSGCRYAQTVNSIFVDGVEFSIINVKIPYEMDYHADVGWLGKSPWNHELNMSDTGVVLPFGTACGNMPCRVINCLATIEMSSSGYLLKWSGKEMLMYSVGEEKEKKIAKAYKLIMEDKQEPCKGGLLCTPIQLCDAVRDDVAELEQIVVFSRAGIFVKRFGTDVFSFIQRPQCLYKSGKQNRRVVKTKEDIELMEFITGHYNEIRRALR